MLNGLNGMWEWMILRVHELGKVELEANWIKVDSGQYHLMRSGA